MDDTLCFAVVVVVGVVMNIAGVVLGWIAGSATERRAWRRGVRK